MKLETVEKKLGLTYPQAFREIYESGAMRWMCGKPQAKSHLGPNLLLKTLNPEYYPHWDFLAFSMVERTRGRLFLRIKLNRGRWKEGAQPLPFAVTTEGDIYFLDAALEDPAAPVFWWIQEYGTIGRVHHSFENFICSNLCWPVLHYGMAADHWWVQNQLRWLTPEHQAVLASGDPAALEALFTQTGCCEDADYISY